MLLINALICNADTLDFKIHLRSDFARCGLIQAIEVKIKFKNFIETSKLLKQNCLIFLICRIIKRKNLSKNFY